MTESCAGISNCHSNVADVTGYVKTCPAGLSSALVQPHSFPIGQHHRRHVADVVVLDQSEAALVIT